jgi:hypothetical protein
MSLYNTLFGVNSLTPILKEMLGIDKVAMPTPPDCLMSEGSDGKYFDYGDRVYEYGTPETEKAWEAFKEICIQAGYFPSGRFRDIFLNDEGTKIILYTRNGGGNRPYYQYVFDLLRKHPLYSTDHDDDFDSTYAYIEFKVPVEYEELCMNLASGVAPEKIGDKFQTLIAKWKDLK